MKIIILAISLFVLSLFSITGCLNLKNKAENKSTFIKVNDTQLELNGKPYYFIGTNFWYGAYLGADSSYGNRERLIKELNHLHSLGVNNLRIAAASEESNFSKPISPPFQ